MNMFMFIDMILIINNIQNKYLIYLYKYFIIKNGKDKSKSFKVKKTRGE